MKVKQTEQEEAGRVELTDTSEFAALPVYNAKFDLRRSVQRATPTEDARSKASSFISVTRFGLSLGSSLIKWTRLIRR